MLNDLLYADDLVMMNETIHRLWNKFIKWMKVFENKGLIVNLGKTRVIFQRMIYLKAMLIHVRSAARE